MRLIANRMGEANSSINADNNSKLNSYVSFQNSPRQFLAANLATQSSDGERVLPSNKIEEPSRVSKHDYLTFSKGDSANQQIRNMEGNTAGELQKVKIFRSVSDTNFLKNAPDQLGSTANPLYSPRGNPIKNQQQETKRQLEQNEVHKPSGNHKTLLQDSFSDSRRHNRTKPRERFSPRGAEESVSENSTSHQKHSIPNQSGLSERFMADAVNSDGEPLSRIQERNEYSTRSNRSGFSNADELGTSPARNIPTYGFTDGSLEQEIKSNPYGSKAMQKPYLIDQTQSQYQQKRLALEQDGIDSARDRKVDGEPTWAQQDRIQSSRPQRWREDTETGVHQQPRFAGEPAVRKTLQSQDFDQSHQLRGRDQRFENLKATGVTSEGTPSPISSPQQESISPRNFNFGNVSEIPARHARQTSTHHIGIDVPTHGLEDPKLRGFSEKGSLNPSNSGSPRGFPSDMDNTNKYTNFRTTNGRQFEVSNQMKSKDAAGLATHEQGINTFSHGYSKEADWQKDASKQTADSGSRRNLQFYHNYERTDQPEDWSDTQSNNEKAPNRFSGTYQSRRSSAAQGLDSTSTFNKAHVEGSYMQQSGYAGSNFESLTSPRNPALNSRKVDFMQYPNTFHNQNERNPAKSTSQNPHCLSGGHEPFTGAKDYRFDERYQDTYSHKRNPPLGRFEGSFSEKTDSNEVILTHHRPSGSDYRPLYIDQTHKVHPAEFSNKINMQNNSETAYFEDDSHLNKRSETPVHDEEKYSKEPAQSLATMKNLQRHYDREPPQMNYFVKGDSANPYQSPIAVSDQSRKDTTNRTGDNPAKQLEDNEPLSNNFSNNKYSRQLPIEQLSQTSDPDIRGTSSPGSRKNNLAMRKSSSPRNYLRSSQAPSVKFVEDLRENNGQDSKNPGKNHTEGSQISPELRLFRRTASYEQSTDFDHIENQKRDPTSSRRDDSYAPTPSAAHSKVPSRISGSDYEVVDLKGSLIPIEDLYKFNLENQSNKGTSSKPVSFSNAQELGNFPRKSPNQMDLLAKHRSLPDAVNGELITDNTDTVRNAANPQSRLQKEEARKNWPRAHSMVEKDVAELSSLNSYSKFSNPNKLPTDESQHSGRTTPSNKVLNAIDKTAKDHKPLYTEQDAQEIFNFKKGNFLFLFFFSYTAQ